MSNHGSNTESVTDTVTDPGSSSRAVTSDLTTLSAQSFQNQDRQFIQDVTRELLGREHLYETYEGETYFDVQKVETYMKKHGPRVYHILRPGMKSINGVENIDNAEKMLEGRWRLLAFLLYIGYPQYFLVFHSRGNKDTHLKVAWSLEELDTLTRRLQDAHVTQSESRIIVDRFEGRQKYAKKAWLESELHELKPKDKNKIESNIDRVLSIFNEQLKHKADDRDMGSHVQEWSRSKITEILQGDYEEAQSVKYLLKHFLGMWKKRHNGKWSFSPLFIRYGEFETYDGSRVFPSCKLMCDPILGGHSTVRIVAVQGNFLCARTKSQLSHTKTTDEAFGDCYSMALKETEIPRAASEKVERTFEMERDILSRRDMRDSPYAIKYLGSFKQTDASPVAKYIMVLEPGVMSMETYFKHPSIRPPNDIDGVFYLWEQIENSTTCLRTLHELGAYHGDLKPANFVLVKDPNGQLQFKMSDFGSAGVSKHAPNQSYNGTLTHGAPEVYRGESPTKQSDIFSIATIWLCMATFVVGGRDLVSDFIEFRLRVAEIKSRELKDAFHNGLRVPDEFNAWIDHLYNRVPVFDSLTPKMLDLIKKMLHEIPTCRPDCAEVLKIIRDNQRLAQEESDKDQRVIHIRKVSSRGSSIMEAMQRDRTRFSNATHENFVNQEKAFSPRITTVANSENLSLSFDSRPCTMQGRSTHTRSKSGEGSLPETKVFRTSVSSPGAPSSPQDAGSCEASAVLAEEELEMTDMMSLERRPTSITHELRTNLMNSWSTATWVASARKLCLRALNGPHYEFFAEYPAAKGRDWKILIDMTPSMKQNSQMVAFAVSQLATKLPITADTIAEICFTSPEIPTTRIDHAKPNVKYVIKAILSAVGKSTISLEKAIENATKSYYAPKGKHASRLSPLSLLILTTAKEQQARLGLLPATLTGIANRLKKTRHDNIANHFTTTFIQVGNYLSPDNSLKIVTFKPEASGPLRFVHVTQFYRPRLNWMMNSLYEYMVRDDDSHPRNIHHSVEDTCRGWNQGLLDKGT